MFDILFSEKFIENALSLLLTAVLTGVLVPLLFRRIDHRRNREQKVFEANLSRQNKVIDSQVKLLEDLSSLLWEYQMLFIEVPYVRQFPKRDLYSAAIKAYEENSGKLLGRIRAEISKSIRLVSPQVYQQLKDLYYKDLLSVDLKLGQLITNNNESEGYTHEWNDVLTYVRDNLADKVDAIIDNLASELKLKTARGKVPEK